MKNYFNYFSEIYNAAKTSNLKFLEEISNSRCIDEWESGKDHFSAITQLAYEEDRKSVELLLKYGSNINYAVKGAGLSGNLSYINQLLKRGASINWAILGTSEGKHRTITDRLKENQDYHEWVIKGACLGGDFDYAKECVDNYLGLSGEKNLIALIENTALSGNQQQARDFIEQYQEQNDLHLLVKLYEAFFRGTVQGAHPLSSEEEASWRLCMGSIAQGAGRGGHFELLRALLKHSNSTYEAIKGLAEAGHYDLMKELLTSESHKFSAVCGAAGGGQRFLLKILVPQISSPSSNYSLLADALSPLAKHISFESKNGQLLFFSFFKRKLLQKMLPIAQEWLITLFDVTVTNKILAVSHYQHENKLTYPQSLAMVEMGQGALFFIMIIVMGEKSHFMSKTISKISMDLWFASFSFLLPTQLSKNEIDGLGFFICRQYLNAQLKIYQLENKNNLHRDKAENFQRALPYVNTKAKLERFVEGQLTILENKEVPANPIEKQGSKQLAKNTNDRYYSILNSWGRLLSGRGSDEETRAYGPHCLS